MDSETYAISVLLFGENDYTDGGLYTVRQTLISAIVGNLSLFLDEEFLSCP